MEQPEWVSLSKRAQRQEELVMVENAIRYGKSGGGGGRNGEEVGIQVDEEMDGECGRNGGESSVGVGNGAMGDDQVECGSERVVEHSGSREQAGYLWL